MKIIKTSNGPGCGSDTACKIADNCRELGTKKTRGELGKGIADIVLVYSSRDLQQMKWNFSNNVRNLDPVYRDLLDEIIIGHLHSTYQNVRIMDQQGTFGSLREPVSDNSPLFWSLVLKQCTTGDGEDRLRFLKFLLTGFCMLVQGLPGHPVGMPFPGGDKVEFIDGIYYCPVRTKADDVDAALCPFCPALQEREIGYLRPPVHGSRRRKQEFIKNCYDYHNFNG